MNYYRHILVPVDFSPYSRAAVDSALDLAKAFGGKVELLHIIDQRYAQLGYGHAFFPVEENYAQLREIAEERLKEFRTQMKLGDEVVSSIRSGVPFDVILERAGEGDVDLIVMGTHGLTGVNRLLLGSQTESVMRRAKVPVLVVHAKAEDAD